MQGNRLVAATLGVVLGVGAMLATAGPAAADSGGSIRATASSSCTDRDRVLITVTVRNKGRHPVTVSVRTPFGREGALVRAGDERTVTIRTHQRSVDRGSATVVARTPWDGDRREITARYAGLRCSGDPRIEVTPRDRDGNDKLDGVKVRNTSSFPIRVRVVIGRQQESAWLAPGRTLEMDANNTQRSGVAIATRRDDGKLHSTVKVFRA